MKNKHTFTTTLGKNICSVPFIVLFALLSVSCSSKTEATQPTESATQEQTISESESNSENYSFDSLSDLTSGTIYQSITELDSNVSLKQSDSCLYVTMDISSGTPKDNIHRFFWDIVQVMQLPGIWDSYTNASFTFMYGNDTANVGISGYSDLCSFNTAHINIIQNQDTAKLFDQFYIATFGSRDLSVAQEKSIYEMSKKTGTSGYELPEEYRAGYLWVFSNFPYSCGYSVNDSSISVQIMANNSKQGGANAANELISAVSSFNQLCNNDPLAMPYKKISVQYLDSSDSSLLWDWCSEKSGSSWSVTKNSSNSAVFADGIHSTAK